MMHQTIARVIVAMWLLLPILDAPARVVDPPSIHNPPSLQTTPWVFNSNIKISPANANRLTQAGEILFNPWQLVTALTWSPNGEIIAVAVGEGIQILDVSKWALRASFQVGALTNSLAFSQDGSWLAAGSRDGLVRLWFQPLTSSSSPELSQPMYKIQAHKKGVNDLAFNPEGRILATGGNDAVARFWDLETGKTLGLMIGGTFAVPSIAFSPDGTSLAVANGRMIRLRQVGSERILGSFQAENPLFCLAYNPDGSWLAAGDTLNQVLLWQPGQAYRTGQERYPQPVILISHRGSPGTYRSLIWDVAFSPDGQLLASAGGDATVRIWDVPNSLLLTTLYGHTSAVTEAAFNSTANALATAGLDGRVLVWKVSP